MRGNRFQGFYFSLSAMKAAQVQASVSQTPVCTYSPVHPLPSSLCMQERVRSFWRDDFFCHYTLLKQTDANCLGAMGLTPSTTGGRAALSLRGGSRSNTCYCDAASALQRMAMQLHQCQLSQGKMCSVEKNAWPPLPGLSAPLV